jgi:chemotaxis protein CheC
MHADEPTGFSTEEQEILQELLNIAFGKATAELAERLDNRLILSVPKVEVMPAVLVRYYAGVELKNLSSMSVVEQRFEGELHGSATLVLPAAAGESLLALVGATHEAPRSELLRDALVEAGNLLIGSCLATLAELLQTTVTCASRSFTVEAQHAFAIQIDRFDPGQATAVLRTAFNFGQADLQGYLFLACSRDSTQWLKPALHRFMAQYE